MQQRRRCLVPHRWVERDAFAQWVPVASGTCPVQPPWLGQWPELEPPATWVCGSPLSSFRSSHMRLVVEGNGDTAGVTGFLRGSEGSIGFFSLLGGGVLPVHQPVGSRGCGWTTWPFLP